MKAYIIYNTDNADPINVEEFLNLVDDSIRPNINLVDKQSYLGAELLERFKILNVPVLIVATDDGQLVNSWENCWPLSHEISYHLREVRL